jgi:hypothetical protein
LIGFGVISVEPLGFITREPLCYLPLCLYLVSHKNIMNHSDTILDYSEIVNFVKWLVFISRFVLSITDGQKYQNCTEFLSLLGFITFIVVHLCCVHPAYCDASLH